MLSNNEAKKTKYGFIVKQFTQNTLAYALPIFFQQFIVFPVMAKKLGAEANGLFLALIALNYFLVTATAAVLVNTRLLRKKEYEEQQLKGDYNLFMIAFAVISVTVVIIGTFFYMGESISTLDVLLSAVIILLFLYHDYIVVQYRAELRFNNILINNILTCVGYLIGLSVLYYLFPHWQIVFIIPYTFTAIYDWFNTDYIKEPLIRTELFGETARKYFILLGSTLLTTLVTYGDRLILYPVMDGTTVSIFISAQLIGKMLQMISTPLSTFILAYLVNLNLKKIKIKPLYIGILVCLVVMLYWACVLVSNPLLHYLYPLWAEESLQYVSLTAANGVILMISVLLNVVALRFCASKWQIVRSALYLVTYMGFSFSFLKIWGLTGFCIGNIISSTVVILFLIIILIKDRVIVFGKTEVSNE